MLIAVYLMTSVIIPKSIGTIKNILPSYLERDTEQFDVKMQELCETVSSLTSEDDAISVYGNMDFVYVKTHRKHATVYSYQYRIGRVMPEIIDQYMQQLSDELPPVIVVQNGYKDDIILNFLNQNGYKMVWPEDITEEGSNDVKPHSVFYRSQDY